MPSPGISIHTIVLLFFAGATAFANAIAIPQPSGLEDTTHPTTRHNLETRDPVDNLLILGRQDENDPDWQACMTQSNEPGKETWPPSSIYWLQNDYQDYTGYPNYTHIVERTDTKSCAVASPENIWTSPWGVFECTETKDKQIKIQGADGKVRPDNWVSVTMTVCETI